MFPFKDSGKTCPGPKCCNLDNGSKGSWCSTKVDAAGNHISGNYAYCAGSTCDPGTNLTIGNILLPNFSIFGMVALLEP